MSAGAGARATTGLFQRLPNCVGQVLTATYFKGNLSSGLTLLICKLKGLRVDGDCVHFNDVQIRVRG